MGDFLIAVPLKGTYEVDFKDALKKALKPKKKHEDDLKKAAEEFGKLRTQAVTKHATKSQFTLDLMSRYYNQIVELAKHQEDLSGVSFTWEDGLEKPSYLKYKANTVSSCLHFERACILFNMAALQSHLAVESFETDTDEERKNAAKYFQNSAGIFHYLSQLDISPFIYSTTTLTPDMQEETLSTLSALMLAQAQEMFVTKAMKDGMKDAIVAKLCAQAEDMYLDVQKKVNQDGKGIWDRAWISNIKGKIAAYKGLSQYFQSRVCSANKSIGEEIARLSIAVERLQKSLEKFSDQKFLPFYVQEASKLKTEAEKDNNFIYHEVVPESDQLDTIVRAASARLAKLTPVPQMFPVESDESLLTKLLPNETGEATDGEKSNSGPTTLKEVVGTTLNALGGYLQNQFKK